MDDSGVVSAAAARLQGLAAYLREDPGNPVLLADACDTAIGCGEFAQAEALLVQAEGLAVVGDEWAFRRARLCIARRDLPQAASLLQELRTRLGEHPAVVHDLAYVALLQGDAARARALVHPWVDGAAANEGALAPDVAEALQLLWLRACHRLAALDEAWAWLRAQEERGGLHPAAGGAASLLAIDRADFESALRLSAAALARHPAQPEALVARASVALARGETGEAEELLQRALQANPHDGRTWSALGLASLRSGDLASARERLERAAGLITEHVGTWHALGWTRLLQGERDAALAAFQRALALDRNFTESHGAVGLLLALRGDSTDAQQHLAVADRLDAHNVTARYARALLAGEAADAQRLDALARRLLDRPGFFGGRLYEAIDGARSSAR